MEFCLSNRSLDRALSTDRKLGLVEPNQVFKKKKEEEITLNCLYVYYHTFCDDFSQEESAEEIIPTAGVVQFLSY